MTLLRWQQNIVDEAGNVLSGAEVEIRDEVSGALVNLFEDIDGNTVKGNPLTVDSDGYGFAYMEPGRFKITATSADQSFTKSWRDVRLANDFSELDSRINQRVIYVGSVAELGSLPSPVAGQVASLSGSRHGRFEWITGDFTSEVAADTENVEYVAWSGDTSPGATGVWKRLYDTELTSANAGATASADITSAVLYAASISRDVPFVFSPVESQIGSKITFPDNRLQWSGTGRASKITWSGGSPATSLFEIDVAGDGSVATLNGRLENLVIDANGADFTDGLIRARYMSRNSIISDIDFGTLGGGIGVYLDKSWYLELQRIRGQNAVRAGTGFYFDTTLSNINDVLCNKIGANNFDTGIVLDSSGSSINSPTFILPAFENCTTGLEFIPGTGVRQMNVYGGYFEGNDVDVQWSSSGVGQQTGDVNWFGVYFNNGNLILEEGNHTLIGCRGIARLEIGPDARVYYAGGGSIASIVYQAGADETNLTYLPAGMTQAKTTQRYNGSFANNVTGDYETATQASGDLNHDFEVPATLLAGSLPAWGGNVMFEIFGRRNYETTSTQYLRGILTVNNSGTWGITVLEDQTTAGMTVTVNSSTGAINVTYTASDFKIVDLKWEPF